MRRVECPKDHPASDLAIKFAGDFKDVLFALDAPLGWPQALGAELRDHQAGGRLNSCADRLFRRDTDSFIKCRVGKQPLDVGADRIARTAVSALCTLKDIGAALAWEPAGRGRRAIEVYPAATLVACGVKVSPYKKPEQEPVREQIVDCLSKLMIVENEMRKDLLGNADLLDAAVCVLAGADFLLGKSLAPEGKCRDTSKKEGWIWVRDPKTPPKCKACVEES